MKEPPPDGARELPNEPVLGEVAKPLEPDVRRERNEPVPPVPKLPVPPLERNEPVEPDENVPLTRPLPKEPVPCGVE